MADELDQLLTRQHHILAHVIRRDVARAIQRAEPERCQLVSPRGLIPGAVMEHASPSVLTNQVGAREGLGENQRAEGTSLVAHLLAQLLVQQLLEEQPHGLQRVLFGDSRSEEEADGEPVRLGRAEHGGAPLREAVGGLLYRREPVDPQVQDGLNGAVVEGEWWWDFGFLRRHVSAPSPIATTQS